MVHHRGHPAGPCQLEQMAEQAEPGYVGGAPDPGGERLPAGSAFSVVITSIAAGLISPVALCQASSTPVPIGWSG